MKMTLHIFVIVMAITVLGILGCNKSADTVTPAPPPQPVGTIQAQVPMQGQISSAQRIQMPVVAVFESQKDPFKPYVTDVKSQAQALRKNRFGQDIPILSYEVGQFSVSGIIVGMKENSALLIDPTGKPYVVKVGMEIGRNSGRITKITPSYLEVFETYRDENGKLIKNTVKLALPKKE